jgi:DNA-binding response OmpR family regulator
MAKIVVMDDEDAIRTAITKVIEREGHEVLAFADAAPALEEVNFEEIDLVVSDLVMPTPGDQFVLILQQEGIEIPVIILSANLNEERIQYLTDLGVEHTLSKPFEFAQLVDVINSVLGS